MSRTDTLKSYGETLVETGRTGLLAALGAGDVAVDRARTVAVAMIVLGLAIEVAQWGLPMLNRQGSGLDWLADGAATLAGLVVVAGARSVLANRIAEPRGR